MFLSFSSAKVFKPSSKSSEVINNFDVLKFGSGGVAKIPFRTFSQHFLKGLASLFFYNNITRYFFLELQLNVLPEIVNKNKMKGSEKKMAMYLNVAS